jgi:hypothetical protein
MAKEKIKEKLSKTAGNLGKGVSAGASAASDTVKKVTVKSKETVEASQKAMLSVLDQDGNGQIDVVDIILMALKVPGTRVNRADFLRKELFKNHPKKVVDKAIATTPAIAGIPREEVDKIVDEVIKFERNAVSGISVALGMPGGAAMVATIPADIAQYYGYMLRAAQKMLYMYGFPELIDSDDEVNLDTETINSLTLCLGIMNGVAGANNIIKGMSKALATGVEKKLINAALTKGAVYPIVKKVATWFGVKMTKEVFAGFFKKSIPVVGGVVGGGITYATFKPCCNRLKNVLEDTMLSNPENHKETAEEQKVYEDIKNGVVYDVEEDELREIDDEVDLVLTEDPNDN